MSSYMQLDDDIDVVRSGHIRIYKPEHFEGMRKAGQLAASALDMIVPHVKPGAITQDLDDMIHEFVLDHGAVSATVGYRGYRHASCISVNHVVCHGIPGPKPLREGDIANIDVTVIVDGWHGDTSRMYAVGDVRRKASRLIDVTYEAMMLGIEAAKPGNRFGDIGAAITAHATKNRLSVVEDFCGHGLGRVFHDAPNVVHSALAGTGPVIEEGMFFTIEPMLNIGRKDVATLSDGWTAVTRDRQLSAQFEHSVGVTKDGAEIFTASPAGIHTPRTLTA